MVVLTHTHDYIVYKRDFLEVVYLSSRASKSFSENKSAHEM